MLKLDMKDPQFVATGSRAALSIIDSVDKVETESGTCFLAGQWNWSRRWTNIARGWDAQMMFWERWTGEI